MNKIKMLISTIMIAIASIVAPIGISTVALAATTANPSGAACGGGNVTGTPGSVGTCESAQNSNLTSIIATIINWFSWIVGAISVIMIIYGGFRYITSGGDQNGVTAAKNTLLYAVIGLIVVALSQVIVKFILGAANGAATS